MSSRKIAEAVATGLGGAVALTVAGRPDGVADAWIAFLGFVVGLLAYLTLERVLGWRRDARRVAEVERQLEAERAHRAEEVKLHRELAARAERALDLTSAYSHIWQGAYNEALETGHPPPLAAVMHRLEQTAKLKGFGRQPLK
jgi:hypothetical protein